MHLILPFAVDSLTKKDANGDTVREMFLSSTRLRHILQELGHLSSSSSPNKSDGAISSEKSDVEEIDEFKQSSHAASIVELRHTLKYNK
jgi:hypothetical protein